jgi:hypothetical protein
MKILFITGFLIPEFNHIYNDIIEVLNSKCYTTTIYFNYNIDIQKLIDKINTHYLDTYTHIILYSSSYILYPFIKNNNKKIIIINPVIVNPIHAITNQYIKLFEPNTFRAILYCIIGIQITEPLDLHIFINYLSIFFKRLIKFISRHNPQWNNDKSLWEGKKTIYIIGRYDILTNIIIKPQNIIYINAKHHINKENAEEVIKHIH